MASSVKDLNSPPSHDWGFIDLPRPRPGAVILISGGLDSAVMAGLAVDRGDPIYPLFVRQGFLWEAEEEAAVRRFLAELERYAPDRVNPLLVSTLSAPRALAGDWAVDPGRPVPNPASPDEAVYLPGRNLALLTQAALAAYTYGVGRIQIGVLSSNPFPDATPEFFRSFENSVHAAMRWRVRVEVPLGHLTKTEALELGYHLRLEHSLSCIRPVAGAHCGDCNKCEERRVAFVRAALPDPTRYLVPARYLVPEGPSA
jgi:7-cyano-7-deazaguanine synthase